MHCGVKNIISPGSIMDGSCPLLALLLSLVANFPSVSQAVKVLKNTLEIGDFESIGGATLVNVSDNVVVQDLTICIKFNVKVHN